ncbi:hypothetical protein CVT24_000272 [Panaeolus cyanescens]|uniref:UTP--glucose-1-phosphate uridylyltransferase n=1 Tax=Panaeolus cyanescens TaxID=181874 RepID=A0A409YDB8_9AGAR|nr:hypothetical protein CVT24_000272 [Panaeolus cyanescens]
MPFFKHQITRFRRRAAKPSASVSLGAGTDPIHQYLDHLLSSSTDPAVVQTSKEELQSFLSVYNRYVDQKTGKQPIEWPRVQPPSGQQIVAHDSLAKAPTVSLDKLAVLKVNGGLGTSMGLGGAKGALEVREDLSFLDLIIHQVEYLNEDRSVQVPLLFMTSFSTEADTSRILQRYATRPVNIITFKQSRHPRLLKDTLLPFARSMHDGKAAWNPSGHGDLYSALHRSGTLERLLSEGKNYLFVSNSDNLGAIVDERILAYMIESQSEFIMEVTNKTKSDLTGGTLIDYEGSLQLLEMAQVPSEYIDEFHSAKKFQIFNTNNLWIDLRGYSFQLTVCLICRSAVVHLALQRIMDQESLALDVIARTKNIEDGRAIVQLETAAGSAIKYFKNACGINVSRERYLPVKNCSDLLAVRSSLFQIERGCLTMNSARTFATIPIIKLDSHFQNIHQFQKRFKQIPDILELDHLTVSGDVYFGRNVTLRGTVIIIANAGQRIDIPDGVVLENRLVSGSIRMIEL